MAWLSRHVQASKPSFLTRLATTRSYGSSSAAALQYDYEEEESQWRLRRGEPSNVESAEGWAPGRGIQWVVTGDPGANSKRRVYAEKLSNLLEVPLISMGSLLRQELHPRSSLYKLIANAVNERKLVPEDVIFGLLSKRLEEGYQRGESGFILDGIPRTKIQAEILDEITDIDLVVNFKCGEEHLVRRDPVCVGSLGSSFDDSSAWKEKLHIYTEQGKELEDYYRKQKKLINFQVAGTPGETWQGLLAALHLKHMIALRSSQKLAV